MIKDHLRYVITTLQDLDKRAILDHLLRLDTEDRYMRFFAAVNDDVLTLYVKDKMSLEESKAFGIYDPNDRDKLIAFAHLTGEEKIAYGCRAELGISIDKNFRNMGLASRLLDRVLTHCRAHGVNTLFMSCLRQNVTMQRLAKRAGLRLVLDHQEALAELNLPEYPVDKAISISHEIAYEQISIMDNCYRRNKQLLKAFWDN